MEFLKTKDLLILLFSCVLLHKVNGVDEVSDVSKVKLDEENENKESNLPELTEPSRTEPPLEPMELQSGPLKFYDGQNFVMNLRKPVLITVFGQEGERKADISLNGEATSVKGSFVKADTKYLVNIDWKGVNFENNGYTLRNIFLTMQFVREAKVYKMIQMNAEGIKIGSDDILSNPLKVKTSNGYKIEAPLGTSFCCSGAGMFKTAGNFTEEDAPRLTVGVSLPDVKLQVFKLGPKGFGPEWDCSELLSIGTWVSLLLSLGFAFICYWGFSMLGGINTMDRFDDPKKKPLHISASD